jgi:hypothetical protein
VEVSEGIRWKEILIIFEYYYFFALTSKWLFSILNRWQLDPRWKSGVNIPIFQHSIIRVCMKYIIHEDFNEIYYWVRNYNRLHDGAAGGGDHAGGGA